MFNRGVINAKEEILPKIKNSLSQCGQDLMIRNNVHFSFQRDFHLHSFFFFLRVSGGFKKSCLREKGRKTVAIVKCREFCVPDKQTQSVENRQTDSKRTVGAKETEAGRGES